MLVPPYWLPDRLFLQVAFLSALRTLRWVMIPIYLVLSASYCPGTVLANSDVQGPARLESLGLGLAYLGSGLLRT
jgi:hypothetical protein